MGCAPSADSFYAPPPHVPIHICAPTEAVVDDTEQGGLAQQRMKVIFLDIDGVLHGCDPMRKLITGPSGAFECDATTNSPARCLARQLALHHLTIVVISHQPVLRTVHV